MIIRSRVYLRFLVTLRRLLKQSFRLLSISLLVIGLAAVGTAATIDPSSTVATTSSSVGIDCQRNFAFVALRVLSGSTGSRLVQVLNLAVEPVTTDPRI